MKLVSLSGTFVCIHKSKWTSNFTEMAKITSSDSVSTIRKLSSHGKLQSLKFLILKHPAGM